ncbi:glycosyltransferase family 2 protein [Romboutsia weinsteinii]|uniref:Glycosyltransferase family 2 protein n=1 Tax=Romboutsia weinsteinii TaxID=2020949 RepID=A0A371IY01_9FIRM|nr:glycosyltransferase family 2 protein [Romboutsia weinsteinii]RDY25336.1 glycosyltransferase family 2 protein [Romboutsia weinsteinii]
MEISLCMIAKNEEDVIARCISSIKDIVDEIIIVDTGSTDNTIEIAKNLGASVYEFEWIDDFSKARNYSFSKATKDYILWLDADDILNPDDIDKFRELKSNVNNLVDSVTMNYVLTVGPKGEFISSLRRNRLVKRERNFKWIGQVHEYLEVYGNIINSDINVIHKKEKAYTNRNLRIYEESIAQGKELSTRDKYYYANELCDNGRYDEAIEQYIKFINTNEGWVEDIKGACSKIADCYSYKKDSENELRYLFKSFEYDVPRADFCCRLGHKFFGENKLDIAIYWYNQAINAAPKEGNLSLINHDTYTFTPWVQLCVCHDRKGDMKLAIECNEMAAKYKPDSPAVKHNREYFKTKIQ